MVAALAFIATFAAAALGTYTVLAWLRRRAILDHPNERSSHRIPTPRGAGLAVVPVILIIWALLAAIGEAPSGVWMAGLIALALMLVSWIDDRRGLPPAVRLTAHIAAAVVGIMAFPANALIFQGLLPPAIDHVVAAIVWIWFINLYNFMDGIDGITAVETAAIGVGVAAIAAIQSGTDLSAALTIVAAGFGFLIWNWHPARIFLGDSGSVPLGFLLGWLLLSLAARGAWAAAMILPAYYLADATITLIARAAAGEAVWKAHRRHFYQIALRGGASHTAVVLRIAFANLLLILLALVSKEQPWLAVAGAGVVVAALLGELLRMSRVRPS
ncbi:MAG TPA: glycosyltransferase family 4 protein [Magnetospirillaceae bacterium]|jgi:UDP-N-acetylmuramyl pentapeptide phosphotransferase/UDP-N-acetylglucosamine-1-phosphate transferase